MIGEGRTAAAVSRYRTGVTVWFTGLPSSGKTTLATALQSRLAADGQKVEVLDGDILRTYLSDDLGFSKEDRDRNVRRVGFVADLLSRNGITVVCSLVSPYRDSRAEVRRLHGDRFLEVYVSTPLHVCADRDRKGLYAKHRSGLMSGLTGVDDPYEPPLAPEVTVPAHLHTVEESLEMILRALGHEGS